jgi:hypothetical protein
MTRNIRMGSGNYYEQSGNVGMGHHSGGMIQDGVTVAGVVNEAEQQNLTAAAAEIQQLLEQLDPFSFSDPTAEQAVAAEAIQQIESNPTLRARILSAIQAGGVSAFEQLLNHPAASFVMAALADWQATNEA